MSGYFYNWELRYFCRILWSWLISVFLTRILTSLGPKDCFDATHNWFVTLIVVILHGHRKKNAFDKIDIQKIIDMVFDCIPTICCSYALFWRCIGWEDATFDASNASSYVLRATDSVWCNSQMVREFAKNRSSVDYWYGFWLYSINFLLLWTHLAMLRIKGRCMEGSCGRGYLC